MKKSDKIKNVIRSKLVTEFGFRRVLGSGRQKFIRIQAASYELALEKALLKYKHIIYHKQIMDLLTAKERAKKASVDTKKPYYVILEGDGECSVNAAPIGDAIHRFVNGEDDKAFQQRKQEKTVSKKVEESVKAPKEEKNVEPIKKQKMEKEVKSPAKKAAKKTAPAKKSAPAKKAAKKAAKKTTSAKGEKNWGKQVTMTNKEMTAKIKKGFIYRNEKGQNKTNYIPQRPNQDLVNENYWEQAPSK